MKTLTTKHFSASFESLGAYECPEWFRDAKFGIWSHWGPQSVAMCGDWYARNMYQQGTPQYNYHVRHYGHPSKFGYKDLCNLWKAEKFDPDYLMEKYYNAGARFFVAQASHHDNFFNYPSVVNKFNCINFGPHKDICGMWKNAAKKFNLPFGISEHLAFSYSWWRTNKGCDSYGPYKDVPYDACNPEYNYIYHNNYEYENKTQWPLDRCLTDNKEFREYWLKSIKEMIDLLEPDLLYSDSALPFSERGIAESAEDFQYGLEAVSYLYNKSIEKNGRNNAVYTQKDNRKEIYKVGILDLERNQMNEIAEDPWESDTCIGGWFYDAKLNYLQPGHIIEMLVDIVSKNGTMLLNILQLPDGSLDQETNWILDELAKWFAINGEAIYGSRPYTVYCEGTNNGNIKGFDESRIPWNDTDLRFTVKNQKLYTFIMAPKGGRSVVIKSIPETENVSSIKLLGHGNVEFRQFAGITTVQMPQELPTEYVNVLEITFARR